MLRYRMNRILKLLEHGDILRIFLLDHYATYQLERRDIWLNRILGFLFGVGTSVFAAIIIGILPL